MIHLHVNSFTFTIASLVLRSARELFLNYIGNYLNYNGNVTKGKWQKLSSLYLFLLQNWNNSIKFHIHILWKMRGKEWTRERTVWKEYIFTNAFYLSELAWNFFSLVASISSHSVNESWIVLSYHLWYFRRIVLI